MAVDGMLVKSSSGAHLIAVRDPTTGTLTTTPAFPTLAGGTPVTLLAVSPTPTLATVVTKVNEVIGRLNAIIAATGLSA